MITEASAQSIPVPDIAEAAGKAVVSVRKFDPRGGEIASGTGWIVEQSGTVVTNYHVIVGGSKLTITISSGETFDRVYVVAVDRLRDLVLLRISAGNLPVLALGSDDRVRVGDKAYVMGNPLGLDRTFSDGLVSARRLLRGSQVLQITAPISPGSSGGPVMNGAGEVIGVASSQFTNGQNLNLAIPSRYVRYLLDGPRQAIVYRDNVAPSDSDERQRGDEASQKELGDEWEATARKELTDWIRRADDDYVQTHEVVTGSLKEGQWEDVEFDLRLGSTYAALGTCDEDCTDLDLGVLDGRKKIVQRDVDDNDHPVVAVSVQRAGAFYVRVLMAKCSAEPCRYAVSMLAQRAPDNHPRGGAGKPSNAVSVSAVQLGSSINLDKTIGVSRRVFGVWDTIYVSVATEGAGTVRLGAKFTYEDQVLVKEDSMVIENIASANSEFHLSKRSPWPTGRYKVELFLNDTLVATEHFSVSTFAPQ